MQLLANKCLPIPGISDYEARSLSSYSYSDEHITDDFENPNTTISLYQFLL